MGKRSAPTTKVIYDRGDTFDRYTGKDLDNTDPSSSVQDFMRDMGEYFDRLNVSKDVRETTTAFVLGLQGMERNLFEVGLRQVLDQLDTGAENISNPLNEGFIGGLEYLEYFAPSLHDFFNDMFGDKDTLPASDVATSFGLTEDQFNSIPAQAERIGAEEETTVEPVEEEEVSLEADPDLMGTSTVEETIGDEDFTTAPLPTPEIIVDEVPIDEIPIEITEPEVEFVDPSTDSGGGGGGGGEESGGDSSAGAGTTATTGGAEAAGGSDGDPVITRDVEAVDDDPLIVNEGDIVGRQIKEAYEAETNPELKEALKEELIAWLEGGAGEPEPIPTTEQPPESTFEPNAGVSGDTAEGEDDFSVVGDLLNIPIDTPESTVPEDVDTSGVTGDTGDAGGAVDGGGAGTDEDGVDTGDWWGSWWWGQYRSSRRQWCRYWRRNWRRLRDWGRHWRRRRLRDWWRIRWYAFWWQWQ